MSVTSSAAGATTLDTKHGSSRASLAVRAANLRAARSAAYAVSQLVDLTCKEAFLAAEHSLWETFAPLKRLEEVKGLYADPAGSGRGTSARQ